MAEGREVIISWSMTNWITVFGMAVLGSLVVGLAWRTIGPMFAKKQQQ
jgi:hypothetical protein